ncbi:MAG: hypothetical protein LBM75_01260 [Myxococcales bacterium]|nr:hypothetical protein [Myxococcales bacterium]
MNEKPQNPNDQRADVKNPNNPAFEKDRLNREKEGHGNAPPPAPKK